MTTYPLATLAYQVNATGVSAPSLADILASQVAKVQSIFGTDLYLDPDSQDYQLLAANAQAIFDANQAGIATYNAFSPASAIGAGLSSIVKQNGIERQAGSNSTCIVSVVGVAGTIITAGSQVKDKGGYLWTFNDDTTIPVSGIVDATVTCATEGDIVAAANTLLIIYTPIYGWQTVTNFAAAVPGGNEEQDGILRLRQAGSTAISSKTSLVAIAGAVASIPGVTRSTVYQNDTNLTDANGLERKSIAVVVEGGDATAIAQAIELEKNAGVGTMGTTSIIVTDPEGLPIAIRFYELTNVPVFYGITIKPLPGYVSTTGDALIAALVAFTNSLAIGEDVYQAWALAEAGLANTPLQQTFVITNLTLGTQAAPAGIGTVGIAFNQAATCATANVTLTVVNG